MFTGEQPALFVNRQAVGLAGRLSEHIYAFFDRPGLVCLDMQSNIVWTRPLGDLRSSYNIASSPILYDGAVIVCCDHDEESFITAINATDGSPRWRTVRPTSQHFATPLLIRPQGGPQIVTNAKIIRAYNADNGELIWSCGEMRPCVTPSPVFSDGLVYVTSGRNGPTAVIDPSGAGDITETHVKVHLTSGGPYVPSPLVYPYLMLPSDNGMMRFVDAEGNVVIKERLRDIFTASPVGAAGKIYWISERGKTYVIDARRIDSTEPSLEVVATNVLEGLFLASPAISDGRLFIRSDKELFCIAETGAGDHLPAPAQVSDRDETAGKTFDQLKELFDQHQAEITNDKETTIRLEAVIAIAKIKDPRTLPFLVDVIKKDHWDISEEAAKLLYQHHGQAAVPSLIELVSDNRAFIKGIAIENLGNLGAVEAIGVLVATSRDANPIIRSSSVLSLGKIAATEQSVSENVFSAMMGSLTDDNGLVREATIDSLLLLAHNVSAKQRGDVITALQHCLDDRNPRVAGKAHDALESSYQTQSSAQSKDTPCFVRYDQRSQLIGPDPRLQELYADDVFFEGPCWDPSTGKLYFVAWGASKQFLRLDEPGKVTVCINDEANVIGINGSIVTRPSRMITAQVFAHKIVSYQVTGAGLVQPEVMAHDASWMQPNDLCQSPGGDIYFSDPQWGGDHRSSAVYVLRRDGAVMKVADDLLGPNGLIVSPDGKTLYVADSLQKLWKAYPVMADGTVGPSRLFYESGDEGSDADQGDLPDGMTIDPLGNVYLTGLGGVRIVSAQGRLLWMIKIPEKASNVTLGGKEGDTLFITCNKKVYGLSLNFTHPQGRL